MVAALGFAGPHIRAQLKFDLLRDADRIVDLDTEISDGAFQLRVTEQQLHGPQVAGLSINLSRFRLAHRVRAIRRTIKPGPLNPSMDDARVLACRDVRLLPETAREQVSVLAGTHGGQPLADCPARLLGDLERALPPASTSSILSRTRSQPLSLLSMARLNIARSRRRPSSWRRTRMVQTSFGFSGRFWPISRPLFQGARWREGVGVSVVMVVSEADPFHLSAGSSWPGRIPYLGRAQ